MRNFAALVAGTIGVLVFGAIAVLTASTPTGAGEEIGREEFTGLGGRVPTATPRPSPTPTTGSIAICKETNPESSRKAFEFNTNIPGMTNLALEDDECDSGGGLMPGRYVVTERPASAWNLRAIDCESASAIDVDVNLDEDRVIIELAAGDHVTCTFINEQELLDPTVTPRQAPTDTPTPTPPTAPVPTATATPDDPPDTPTPQAATPTSDDDPTDTPVPPAATSTTSPVIPANLGDVNLNGVVNAIDAQLILQKEAFPNIVVLASPENADVNQDGTVNSIDALAILHLELTGQVSPIVSTPTPTP